jgi:uncharacterized membrane protein
MHIDKAVLSYILLCMNTLRIFNFLHPIKNIKNLFICYYLYYNIIIIIIAVNLGVRRVKSVPGNSTQNCNVARYLY